MTQYLVKYPSGKTFKVQGLLKQIRVAHRICPVIFTGDPDSPDSPAIFLDDRALITDPTGAVVFGPDTCVDGSTPEPKT